MNKILSATFLIVFCVISLCLAFIFSDYQQYAHLYKNKTPIAISYSGETNSTDQINKMKALTESRGINFSNIVSINANNYYVYTTNRHDIEASKSKEKLDLFDNTINIYVKSFQNDLTERMILTNIFWFESSEKKLDSTELIKTLYKELDVTNVELIENMQSLKIDHNYYLIAIFMSISVFLLIFAIIASNLKMLGILELEGYTLKDIYQKFIIKYKHIMLFSFSSSSLATLIFLIAVFKSSYRSILLFFLIFYLVSITSFSLLLLLSIVSQKIFRRVDKMKNKQYYRILIVLFSGLTFLSMVFYFFSSNALKSEYNHSQKLFNKKEEWKKTENFYKTFLTYSGEKDIKKERKTSQQLETFYKKAFEKDQNLFILDSSNYYPMGNSFIYEHNDGNELTSPGGKKITITPNYLMINSIFSKVETEKIMNQIVWDDYTRNVLVPEKLKKLEDGIRKNYLEVFKFKKIVVGNIYAEKMADRPVDVQQDLNINVIYVPDNKKYFSYDLTTAFTKIIDPVVELETFNIDISYYNMYASTSTYFYYIGDNPYTLVNSTAVKNSNNIQVKSVYTDLSDDLQSSKKTLEKIVLQTLATVVSLSVVICSWISSFYLFQEKKHRLKLRQGSRYWQLNSSIFLVVLLIVCFSIGVSWLLTSVNYYSLTFITIYLMLILFYCSRYFYSKLKRN